MINLSKAFRFINWELNIIRSRQYTLETKLHSLSAQLDYWGFTPCESSFAPSRQRSSSIPPEVRVKTLQQALEGVYRLFLASRSPLGVLLVLSERQKPSWASRAPQGPLIRCRDHLIKFEVWHIWRLRVKNWAKAALRSVPATLQVWDLSKRSRPMFVFNQF